ncbi:unnamed protein product [Mytilus coruscus]|uniref:NCAM n=1 Tax=Mytilus coruscus TaxID=42192 RepID=A0A6J8A221_MYTCO|nr:unnamed protein product [Mytilus coruscus]
MTFHRYIAVTSALTVVLICIGSCTLITPKDIYSAIGSTVNLTCNLNVDRMYVTWLGPPNLTSYALGNSVHKTKNSSIRILGHDQERQHILQILKMHETDEGLYKCTAVEGNKSFQLFIQKPPRNMTVEESNNKGIVFGVVNQKMNLTCDVETGKPAEAMRWEYGHEVVANGGPGSLTHIFTPDSTHHLQTFRCVAFNNVTKTSLTEAVTLYLYSEPTVKIIPGGTVNTTEDGTLKLECNYTSNDNESTHVSWKYPLDGYINKTARKVMTFDGIKRSNAGPYTCVVSNSAGKAEDTVTVNVFYSPAVNITLLDQQPDKYLKCKAYGNPENYVFSAWEHRTEYGDHIRFLNDSGSGCIKLKHSSGETKRHYDEGVYICSVSNGVPYDGTFSRRANYTLKQKGLPYFSSINKKIQYGILRNESNLTLNVVSNPKIINITVYDNNSVLIKDVDYKIQSSKIKDKVYGKTVNIKGYKLFVPIKTSVSEEFMIYSIVVTNAYGQCNISVDFRSASIPMEPTQLIAIPGPHTIKLTWQKGFDGGLNQSFVVEYRILGSSDDWKDEKVDTFNYAVIDGLESETDFILRVYSQNDLGTSNRSKEILVKTVGVQGMENGIYDMQNNLAPDPAAQSNDPPVYSSIDRKHKLSICQAVSYSVTKKTKKTNPLTGRNRRRNKGEQQTETDFDMSTSQAEDNYQLNYVDVCFDPKPVGHHFEIHGMDKKSEYVDIDFSKSITILPDSEKMDSSDEDFSSVDDVIATKRDMML